MLLSVLPCYSSFFFFNDTATTEIYTLSLHDALPISVCEGDARVAVGAGTHQVAFVQRNTQRSVHPLHGADFLHLNVTVKIYESRALLVRGDGVGLGKIGRAHV